MINTIAGKTFIHTTSGTVYNTVEWIRVKVLDTWIEVIVYHEPDTPNKKYARSYEDFMAKFTEVPK